MIGVFDSGCGGLTILRQLVERLPQYSYCYLGDNARAPYGTRSADKIYAYTAECVDWLFLQGATLVILGCNTASANALRRLQHEYLPKHWPDRKVLGILVPTVEAITDAVSHSPEGEPFNVAVFATPATVASEAYVHEIQKRNPRVTVWQQACPNLVEMVEHYAIRAELEKAVQGYVHELERRMTARDAWPPDAVLLACTHYALLSDIFTAAFHDGMLIYDQAGMVAEKTIDYLARHPEIESRLARGGGVKAFTTAEETWVTELNAKFFGAPMQFSRVTISLQE